MVSIPECSVKFFGVLETYQPVAIKAFHIRDLLNGINSTYEDFNQKVYQLFAKGYQFIIKVNGEYARCESDFMKRFTLSRNQIEIHSLVEFSGNNVLGIVFGVGLLALAFTGVGILGISATTFGLLGASLLFSTIFSSPKTDSSKPADKRSINFSGTINVVGGSSPVPIVMGRNVWIGSIVVSADLIPQQRSLT